MENLIDIMQLSTQEIDELVKKGCDIMPKSRLAEIILDHMHEL